MYLILVVILILLVIGGLPHWPYAQPYAWGYYPSGVFTVLLIVLLVMVLTGYRF
jgi:hypothetical protein